MSGRHGAAGSVTRIDTEKQDMANKIVTQAPMLPAPPGTEDAQKEPVAKPRRLRYKKQERGVRFGKGVSLWINKDLFEALDVYVDTTEPIVTKRATIEAALRDFLRQRGYWPLSQMQKKLRNFEIANT
jgi:hypothetical protein